MRNFSDFIQSYLEYTSSQESSPRIKTMIAVSIIAAALERKVYLDFDYFKLFPNLYTLIIGPSGLSKKSTAIAIGSDILRESKTANMFNDVLDGHKLLNHIKHAAGFYVMNNVHIKQSALYVIASELKSQVRKNGSTLEMLTELYDGRPYEFNAAWSYNNKNPIYGPCLNFLGASTPTWLKEFLGKREMEGGFTSRVLFVVENDSPSTFNAWPEMTPVVKEMKLKLVQDIKHIGQMCGRMSIDEEAKKVFEIWYNDHCTRSLPLAQDKQWVGYMSRKPDLIKKLAMIRSVSRNDSLSIGRDDIVWADDLLAYLEKDMFTLFEKPDTDPILYGVSQLIYSRDKITRVELEKLMMGVASSKQVIGALQELINIGNIFALNIENTIYYVREGSDLTHQYDPLFGRAAVLLQTSQQSE